MNAPHGAGSDMTNSGAVNRVKGLMEALEQSVAAANQKRHEGEGHMAFHAMQGWYFERMDDGGVRITRMDQRPDHQGELIAGVELPAATWCLAVASVSANGENSDTYSGATRLHDGEGYSDTAPGWADDPRNRNSRQVTHPRDLHG